MMYIQSVYNLLPALLSMTIRTSRSSTYFVSLVMDKHYDTKWFDISSYSVLDPAASNQHWWLPEACEVFCFF